MKNYIKIIFALTLCFAMVFSFAACGDDKKTDSSSNNTTNEKGETITGDLIKAEIEIVNYGTIKLDLYADKAPKTVANFVNLAKSGFYDGLTFHRIIADFMMQGGDPLGNGTGGNTDKDGNEINVVGEFALNGYNNDISHTRGTISMARSGSYYEQYLAYGYTLADFPEEAKSDLNRAFNSGSSQFFIMHKDNTRLDGSYAAFGKVTEGMDVVDKACETANPTDDNGTIPAADQPVIKTIRIIE